MEEYLAAMEAGRRPNRREFLADHADIAGPLGKCLDGLEFIHSAAPQLHPPNHDRPSPPSGEVHPEGPLGDFRIIREVGRGGMGVVYEAMQISLGRRVALKVLPFAATMDSRHLQRFQNEARAAASLHHTNIVPVYYVGCERGIHYYAMQFIEGRDLASVLAQLREQAGRTGPELATDVKTVDAADHEVVAPAAVPAADTRPIAGLSTERSAKSLEYFRGVARLGIQAAEALDHAHQMGIVHRDVKPANLLIDAAGRLWITDFGLAQIQSDTRLTMTGDLLGTLRYMSPEQALAQRVVVDHRTDVYSLGATLYELLALQPAYPGTDRQELLRQIAFEEPRRLRRLNRAVPAELEIIVAKALEKNPVDRFATAQELADDLQRFLLDKPIQARRPGLVRRGRKWMKRNRALVWSSAAAALVTVAVLAGSVGWVGWDRAVRQAASKAEVNRALKEVQRLQDRSQWSQALEIALQTQALLETSNGTEALRREVRERVKDLRMIVRLEEIRRIHAVLITDEQSVESEYRKAFQEYGLDVDRLSPEEAARIVQRKSVRLELVLSLDFWARVRRQRDKNNENSWRRLQAIAEAADPDEWRNRFRQVWGGENEKEMPKSLEKLTASAKVDELLPESIVLLALAMRDAGRPEQAAAFLRKAQQRHAGNFFINQELAFVLDHSSPPRPEEAIRYYAASIALRPDYANSRTDLAHAFFDKGELDEAVAASREAIRLSPGAPDVYRCLGLILAAQGNYVEAAEAFRKCIELRPDDLRRNSGLATEVFTLGKVDLALPLFEQVLEKQKATLGPDHSDTLMSMDGLACCYAELHRLPEAIALLEETVAKSKAKLGPDDRNTLVHMRNLGVFYQRADRLPEAIALLEETVAKSKAKLGSDHLVTLDYMHSLADCYWQGDRRPEAIALLEETVAKSKGKYGPDDRKTLVYMNELAFFYREADRLPEAIGLIEETMLKSKSRFGPDDSNTRLCMVNLASCYAATDRLPQAIAMLEQMVQKSKEKSSPGDRNSLGYMATLATFYWQAERLPEAIALFEETIVKCKATDHPDALLIMIALANCYQHAGKLDQAEPLLLDLLERRRKEDGPRSAATASVLAALGRNLLKQEKYVQAEPLLRDCLTIRAEKVPDHWSWSRFNAVSMLGGALLGQKRYFVAEPLLLQGYEGMKQREAKIRPISKILLTEAVERIVRLYEATNQPDKARAWREKMKPKRPDAKSDEIK